QAARALHLQEEEFGGVGRPGDFEPAAFERPALDRRAVVITDEFTVLDAAADLAPLQIVGELAEVDVDEISGTAIDRDVVTRPLGVRSSDFGFVIAGDEGGARADLHRAEIAGEEGERVLVRPVFRRSAAFAPVGAL